jgi:hypothetical protein
MTSIFRCASLLFNRFLLSFIRIIVDTLLARYEASTPCWSQTTVSIISSSSIGKIKNRSRGDRSYYAAVLQIKVLWTVHHLAFPHFPDVCQFFVSEMESIVAARLVPYANSVNNRAPAQLIQSYMIQGERYPAGGAVKANGNL